jgi:hypothetical protein
MRLLILQTFAAALAAAVLTLPAEAASAGHLRHHKPRLNEIYSATKPVSGFGGYGTGPFWQGEPTDNLPIWRYGYYQGNDPDPFIRLQLMRDPTNRG